MKRLEKIISVLILSIVCTANIALAVPVKVDEDNARPVATVTAKPDSTAKTTEKATNKPKESPKSTEKSTQKATEKATINPTATAKSKATATPDDEKIVLDADDEAIVLEPTMEPTLNIQNGSEQFENKKYLTKVGAFLWFLFTVIVSAIISFAISYRFYMMGKRDNHIAAEIRALKRDVDSKMVGTIGGFTEFDVSISNNNKSYAKENSSIHSSKSASEGDADIDGEIYKKWETKLNETSRDRGAEKPNMGYSSDIRTGTRRVSRSVERRRPVKSKNTVGVKIKNVFNELFPFDKK